MALISVIIPVYRVEAFLDRCMESVLRQTFRDFEVILVDDGSPDKCPQMCDEWAKKDNRITVLHQKNQGLSAARNHAIRVAKGEYLTFIDSDDWISDTMLEDLLALIQKYHADMAICNFIRTDGSAPVPKSQDIQEAVYTKDEFMKIIMKVNGNRNIHYAWGKLYARKVIDFENHYPVGMLNEDVEGMFKAAICADKIAETSKIGYFYYENPESISRKKFGDNFLCLREVWQRVLSIAKEKAPEYLEYVEYNFMRIDFTILMDMILYGDKETDAKYADERLRLKKSLSGNMKKLLKGYAPINRKLFMILVCYCYPFTRLVIRTLKPQK